MPQVLRRAWHALQLEFRSTVVARKSKSCGKYVCFFSRTVRTSLKCTFNRTCSYLSGIVGLIEGSGLNTPVCWLLRIAGSAGRAAGGTPTWWIGGGSQLDFTQRRRRMSTGRLYRRVPAGDRHALDARQRPWPAGPWPWPRRQESQAGLGRDVRVQSGGGQQGRRWRVLGQREAQQRCRRTDR